MFSLKGLIQATIIHYLSRKCVLWNFIENLNSFLTDIKVCEGVQKHEKDFKRKNDIGLGVTMFFIVLFTTILFLMHSGKFDSDMSKDLLIDHFPGNKTVE